MKKEWLNKTASLRDGREFSIIGWASRSRQAPVLIQMTETGSKFRYDIATIIRAFNYGVKDFLISFDNKAQV